MAGFTRTKSKKRGRNTKSASAQSVDALVCSAFQKARVQQGLTQGELAKIVHTKQSAISRFESGRYNPSIDFLQTLAKALGKRVEVRLK